MRKYLIFLLVIEIICGCSSPNARNNWQKKINFNNKHPVYYNEFVANGGMRNDGEQPHGLKKEIQSAIKQGRIDYKYS